MRKALPSLSLPSGIFGVAKPPGWTSADVIRKLKGTIGNDLKARAAAAAAATAAASLPPHGARIPKVKIGHGGTLDPAATGVLAVGLGKGTKRLTSLLKGDKAYECTGVLGRATDTFDAEGVTIAEEDFSHVTRAMMEAALPALTGDILQVPPMHSALKHNGRRLHELARAGKVVERPPRPAFVGNLELTFFEPPRFGLAITCGGGFYVRVCVNDLAKAVGTCAHAESIHRTRQGPIELAHCASLDELDGLHKVEEHLRLNGFPPVP